MKNKAVPSSNGLSFEIILSLVTILSKALVFIITCMFYS